MFSSIANEKPPIAPAISDLHVALAYTVTVDDDVAQAILRIAEQEEHTTENGISQRCDAIAMTTHGYGALQRWATGSMTGRILHSTHLPLLIIRPIDLLPEE